MITFDGKKISWYDGITIFKLLSRIEFGDRYAVVKLNGKLISKPNFKTTVISDNSDIVPLPMIAGG